MVLLFVLLQPMFMIKKTLFVPIDEKGYTESGTFLKMIVLLPYFAQYNVDCIYLLPVTQSSDKFKKEK